MSLEMEFSPDANRSFQPTIEYITPEDNPTAVASATAIILDRYFSGFTPPSWESRFLANQTLDLVANAKKGFLGNVKSIRDIGKINPQFLAVLNMNKPHIEKETGHEETETFARMYIAMGILPSFATHEMLPKGYSKRGVLEPPFTTEEVMGRIDEVGVNVQKVIGGRIDQRDHIINHPGALRTYWTFQAMGNMPSYQPSMEMESRFYNETLEAMAEKFKNPMDR